MVFNPNDMTTDGMLGWPWKRSAEPALLESQLVLIRYNSQRIIQKIKRGRDTRKDSRELRMWTEMNNVILGEIKVHVIDAHGSMRGFIISTTQGSMFDELSKCLDFNRWKYVSLCTLDENNKSDHEWGSNGMRDYESFKKEIDGDVRRRISECRQKGFMLHFEIQEKQPEKIELRIFQAAMPGIDNPHSYPESRQIDIGTSDQWRNVFNGIVTFVAHNDWGVVELTDGKKHVILYEERSTVKNITMDNTTPPKEEGDFNNAFFAGIAQFKSEGKVGKDVWLEIKKRFISNTPNAGAQSHEAEANSLAARFQSITWV